MSVIPNPAGVWGTTATSDDLPRTVKNNAGTSLAIGDVVVYSDASGTVVDDTTTANHVDAAVCVSAAEDGKSVMVARPGQVVRIQIGANTVADGDLLATSTTAKTAVTNGSATFGQALAVALEASAAKDSNNTIRARVLK